ncbi:variable surface family protein [Brachyspira hyodysenteriae]|uniref:variable surface family protein n=1 Tax=Brachyspira hyodysenteriae TaxID=159 RepID=UPI000A147CC7|nr:variable surface family protein [Brachyspira hyodysenteriae]MCZ9886590.1 variable surface family protein [Brachyspira hyodysenteriae]MCZ9919482.1 variable surface family protein [Brachyspira hyodysenteriae]MCZ9964200.1 variable surface family protein [Brachyspira hyodysenteriae]MCZ9981292.1 variable surface family protein [Brachyspira hyodysenteriae]MDA0034871.1 variable surface family protein [Brachyspira hyodysenteriae]
MKKVLLTAMALLTIASASAFGMYGDRDSWIDFLTHGNQFRARMDQLGFVLGNGTIKGTFGFRSQAIGTALGNIISGNTGNVDLKTTISAGIGYTSEPFGIGVGYNYTYVNPRLGVHTPVLMINALNNNLRIAVPVQIAVSHDPFNDSAKFPYSSSTKDYMGISTDIQLRYYTGIDAFNAIRLYFKYGQAGFKTANGASEYFAQSLGFEARFYFLNTPVGNVTINPFIKVVYNTALKGVSRTVRAGEAVQNTVSGYNPYDPNSKLDAFAGRNIDKDFKWDSNPYDVKAQAVLGITANSDVVSLYVEPSLGYQATYLGKHTSENPDLNIDSKVQHSLAWGAYAELYVRPVQDLEWYFEMDVNNGGTRQESGIPVYFETTTGITWYLPAFN